MARSEKVYKIVDIPKPDNLPAKRAGETKYPLAQLKVGGSFVVPYSEMREGETSEKFRARVSKSAREFARRNAQDGQDRLEFTIVVMPEDDDQDPMRYAAGDVVVWRDK